MSSKHAWAEPAVLPYTRSHCAQPKPHHETSVVLWLYGNCLPVSLGRPSSHSCPAASRWTGQLLLARLSPCALHSRCLMPQISQLPEIAWKTDRKGKAELLKPRAELYGAHSPDERWLPEVTAQLFDSLLLQHNAAATNNLRLQSTKMTPHWELGSSASPCIIL